MNVRQIINIIEKEGWYLVRQSGSHKQYKHPLKKGLVTISAHRLSDDVLPKTASSILKQAGIKEN